MKFLLTGACGLVGTAIRRACEGVHEIVSVDTSGDVASISGVQANVTDLDAMKRAALDCDAIIHTAAMHGGHLKNASHQEFIQTNVAGAENLFEAAREHGIRRLVMSSTLDILCGIDWSASGITVYDDCTPPRPDTIYSVTKLMAEELGHFYARQHGLEVIQLRYVYVRGIPMQKIGLGLLARSIADSDVAQANVLAATTPGLKDHVFLIGPETPLDLKDVMQALSEPWAVLERHWPGCRQVLEAHDLAPRASNFWPVCRIDQARRFLGWEPKVTFERFLKQLGWEPGRGS